MFTKRTRLLSGNHLSRLALSTAILLGGALAAQAAPMPNTLAAAAAKADTAEVRSALQAAGFSDVQAVAHSGNVYRTKARWEGRWVDLRIDARNGGIADLSAGTPAIGATHALSDDQLRDRLAQVGYARVGPIERRGNVIRTTASQAGAPVTLAIDARTGAIRQAAGGATAIPVPRENLSAAELQAQLRALGYTDVRQVEEEGSVYSLQARRNGEWVALRIDADNGAVRVAR